ncbi:MAG: pyruvate kinase [Chlamydiota bacterium]|jgi:pyruvate kinase
MAYTRTKIICTIGPAVNSYEKILELVDAGMNVARLNFSHGTHENHQATIENLKRAREKRKVPLAIMLDTKGPEIRLGKIKGDALKVSKGQLLKIVPDPDPNDENQITIHPFSVLITINKGMNILFDDGYVSSKIVEKTEKEVTIEILNDGVLKSNKGVNIPKAHLNLPAMTDKDIEDLIFGCQQDIDIVAASFIRSSDHVLAIKELLKQQGKSEILVIAKIENSQGVENFDSIVQVADGIMIARGDLGVELDLGDVPRLQKMMIKKCYHSCKPVVTATQMLESMILNPRPTRAEVSDVANAIYDASSAVMLSGETAVGNYPIEAVKQMKHIAESTEADFDYKEFFRSHSNRDYHDISSSVALAAVKTAYSAGAKAIFAYTSSGFTARLTSRLRPKMPIFALTPKKKNYHQLAFNWGVTPIYAEKYNNKQEAFSLVQEYALKNGFIEFGDLVVVTAGTPFGKVGSTNMMVVENIGNVLIRASKGHGNKVNGKIVFVLSPEAQDPMVTEGKIAVLPSCDNRFLAFIKHAKGVILQNHIDDHASEKYLLLVAKSFDIPTVVRAEGALATLKENESITVDPKRGLIYRG